MIVTSDSTALIAMSIDDEDGEPDRDEPSQRRIGLRATRAEHAADDHEREHRHADGPDHAERLADEDLDFEPGQRPKAAQHACVLNREWSGPSP